jgi:hypothetical protein
MSSNINPAQAASLQNPPYYNDPQLDALESQIQAVENKMNSDPANASQYEGQLAVLLAEAQMIRNGETEDQGPVTPIIKNEQEQIQDQAANLPSIPGINPSSILSLIQKC